MLNWNDYTKLIQEIFTKLRYGTIDNPEEVAKELQSKYELYNSENPQFIRNINDSFELFNTSTSESTHKDVFKKGLSYFTISATPVQEADEETISSNTPDKNGKVKIRWKSGPAMLGHLFDELDRNGYIENPFSNVQFAKFLKEIFDFQGTANSLANELSEKTNSLTPDKKGVITIKPNPDRKL